MKSLILNVFWPAWEWGPKHLTHLRGLGISHKQDLALRDNIKLRRLITSDWYKERYPHVVLRRDQNSKIKFENTHTGFNEIMAFGSITGSRGDRVRIDDPLSVEDAKSKIILASREFLFKEAVPTRLVSPEFSVIVLIMQRLHEMDTTALALELGYEHLMLPMEFEPERRCKTNIGFIDPREEDGELLFPARFPRHVVDRDKKSLGKYGHAAQNQQRPAPREGAIIKAEWLKNRFRVQKDAAGNVILNFYDEIYQSWDTAFKEGQENDYSVCTTWGVRENGFYLLHRWKMRVDFPTLEQRAIELANYFKPNQIFIEDMASGQSLIQAIKRRTRLPVKAVKIDRDKSARLNAVSGYFEANRVFLPDEPWVDEPDGYAYELTTFPAVKHDDSVDSTSQFLLEVALRREARLKPSSGSTIAR
jgi:predicted phage terminase large subunit-like protein